MITFGQYFGSKARTPQHEANARDLLGRVDGLLGEAAAAGAYGYPIDNDTLSQISGSKGGAGDGGFRLPGSTTGAPGSSHKEARGVDVFDPGDKLDNWLTDEILERHGLYREHSKHTPGWCHLTTRPPRSKRRTFTLR